MVGITISWCTWPLVAAWRGSLKLPVGDVHSQNCTLVFKFIQDDQLSVQSIDITILNIVECFVFT